jgi:hypothetical protein
MIAFVTTKNTSTQYGLPTGDAASPRADNTAASQRGLVRQPTEDTATRMPATTLLPEWVDVRRANQLYSLCKSTLYRLAEEGKIRTVSLRDRGKLRGKRLFSTASISELLESRATGGERES